MNEVLKKSAAEQSRALKNKEISAVELVNAAFERIEEVDEKLGAFNSLTKETALETAKKVDEKIAKGEELPLLAGVPLALKDNMNLKAQKQPLPAKFWKILFHLLMQQLRKNFYRTLFRLSEKLILMNLQWVHQMKTQHLKKFTIRGI